MSREKRQAQNFEIEENDDQHQDPRQKYANRMSASRGVKRKRDQYAFATNSQQQYADDQYDMESAPHDDGEYVQSDENSSNLRKRNHKRREAPAGLSENAKGRRDKHREGGSYESD